MSNLQHVWNDVSTGFGDLLNIQIACSTHDAYSIRSCLPTPKVLEETGLTLRNARFERVENCVHTKDGAIVAHYVTIFMRGEVDQVGVDLFRGIERRR